MIKEFLLFTFIIDRHWAGILPQKQFSLDKFIFLKHNFLLFISDIFRLCLQYTLSIYASSNHGKPVFRYAATVRVQQHRQEIIHELCAMVKEHLVMFYKSTGGYKPHRIIIYR